ncbi:MAG TPA: hypothetical protein VE954_35135 [Oligoflexus sp.]|uniref:hypothetical protein n=1 Tax=Oligoflexus sp. TaxID=1971216 RepID=UPI002D61DE8E|nr:hypothetical protein [Oligoflexus sp.]HYX38367.1 hypothetical protein [Oligoflexus sp.]
MKKTMHCMSILALSLGSNICAAEEEGDHMVVTAPNECCDVMPAGLSILSGWVGASGAGAASATLKAAALKAAEKKAAEQKTKKEKDKEDAKQEESEFQQFAQNNPGVFRCFFMNWV